jgi:hypothetical protein
MPDLSLLADPASTPRTRDVMRKPSIFRPVKSPAFTRKTKPTNTKIHP